MYDELVARQQSSVLGSDAQERPHITDPFVGLGSTLG